MLDPKQVRFVAPFLSGLMPGRLAFYGNRNAVHLQETALVVEGELLRFHFLGLERFFARALSEWTTVTVPYGRIVRVKYRSKIVVRVLLVLPAVLFGLLAVVAVKDMKPADLTGPITLLVGCLLLIGLILYLVLRRLVPTYTITFRSKDGKKRAFSFAVRSKAARREFDAALAAYRDAARAHAGKGGGR
jgi:hypothetical protein